MAKTTDNVFEFITSLDNHKKFVESHAKYNIPINYEIEDGKMRISHLHDVEYEFKKSYLEEAMNVIADWTNNTYNCGCTFTIGW